MMTNYNFNQHLWKHRASVASSLPYLKKKKKELQYGRETWSSSGENEDVYCDVMTWLCGHSLASRRFKLNQLQNLARIGGKR